MSLLFGENDQAAAGGLLIGVVMNNYDEDHAGMVQVSLQGYKSDAEKIGWMRVLTPMAGKGKGFYFFPDVGDVVVVGFINNDINNPLVLGSLWNETESYPDGSFTEKNTIKRIRTKAGVEIALDDEEKKESIKIGTPKDLSVRISDENGLIEIKDSKGDVITIDSENNTIKITAKEKIVIEANTIEISAKNKLSIDAGKAELNAKNQIDLLSKSKVFIESAQVEISSKATLTAKSSGITQINGSMVKING